MRFDPNQLTEIQRDMGGDFSLIFSNKWWLFYLLYRFVKHSFSIWSYFRCAFQASQVGNEHDISHLDEWIIDHVVIKHPQSVKLASCEVWFISILIWIKNVSTIN